METANHKKILGAALGSPFPKSYLREFPTTLLAQIFLQSDLQDISGVTVSKYHFDNSALQTGMQYVKDCWKEIDGYLATLKRHVGDSGFTEAMELAVARSWGDYTGSIYSNLGRITHSVADFYAHTNWVEGHVEAGKRVQPYDFIKVPRLPRKLPNGKALVSGNYNLLGDKSGHTAIAKDSATSKRGKMKIKTGPYAKQTYFKVAFGVAVLSTRAVLKEYVRRKRAKVGSRMAP